MKLEERVCRFILQSGSAEKKIVLPGIKQGSFLDQCEQVCCSHRQNYPFWIIIPRISWLRDSRLCILKGTFPSSPLSWIRAAGQASKQKIQSKPNQNKQQQQKLLFLFNERPLCTQRFSLFVKINLILLSFLLSPASHFYSAC